MIWRTLERYPRATAQAVEGALVALLIAAAVLLIAPQVDAAEPDTVPISDNCVLDSELGIYDVFYCESEFGVDYLANSFGFMVQVD